MLNKRMTQQIGQPMKPVGGADDAPTGAWAFQFMPDQPARLTMRVTVAIQPSPPVDLDLQSEMDKNEVTQVIEWLSRIVAEMDDSA